MKPIRIAVLISGGNCQGVLTDAPDKIARKITVHLHDEDNLKEEGKDVGRAYNKVCRENPTQLL